MSTITQLSAVMSVAGGDQVPLFTINSQTSRRATIDQLAAYIQAGLVIPTGRIATQYAAPSATGFSVAIGAVTADVHLILTPTAPFASGIIVLPPAPADGQMVRVNTTQAVTALTISANSPQVVTGGPSTLAANDAFSLAYDLPSRTWYMLDRSVQNPASVDAAQTLTNKTLTSPTLVTPNLGAATASNLSRGAPQTKSIAFTVAATDNWIICNGAASIVVTLPAPATSIGREIMLKNIAAFTVVSASANVAPINSATPGTAILPATTGSSVTLVSDGTNWVAMA